MNLTKENVYEKFNEFYMQACQHFPFMVLPQFANNSQQRSVLCCA
jgi:hypothetical protein